MPTTLPTPAATPASASAPAPGLAMRAVVQDRYGSADVLELTTVPRPQIGAGQVLVEVHAAGVDRGTWHVLTGMPYIARLAGIGFRRPKVRTPGLDVAGRV